VSDARVKITYIGGPTALLEVGGLRLLTDPTFDPAGSEYGTAAYVLRKSQGPALGPESLGGVDAVLLSHDHHFDNLDTTGRGLLSRTASRGMQLQGSGERDRLVTPRRAPPAPRRPGRFGHPPKALPGPGAPSP
jgi:Beta-lactamase superfamily domain